MPDNLIAHIVDDDDALRDSLSFLLSTANIDTKVYDSANAFLSACSVTMTGCVVTDIRMPGMSGLDLMRRLKELGLALPVIVITGHGDVPLAVEAMRAGAVDFIEKPFEEEVILKSVRSALSNVAARNERRAEIADIQTRLASLSSRERQVLGGLVAGHANKVIAYDLGISARTVEVYRANVMTKMQAGSLSELVRLALLVNAF